MLGIPDGVTQCCLLPVAYTPATRQSLGGTAATEAFIDMAVAMTNQSYANSNITQRLNLVHTVEVNY